MKSAADIGVQTNRLTRAAEGNPARQARINNIGGAMYRNLSRLNTANNRSVFQQYSRAVRQGRGLGLSNG
ncbi:MAG TPA: hypothetical protein DHV19_01210 [Bacteroides cellulosilyticus]|jgi:hypothetical protein|nr:hypothetical protein [Bacteroides cellulosilyticus]